MLRRKTLKTLTRLFTNSLAPLLRPAAAPSRRKASAPAAAPARAAAPRTAAAAPGHAGRWVSGVAVGAAGKRRYRLFLPPGLRAGAPVPLVVMLHGCDQNAARFAASTRMHQLAARAGFAVLYPDQDRLAHPHGCWNWYDTRGGRARAEAGLVLRAIDQACLLYGADPARVAIAGLSAGAGMAALVATRHPERFRAVAMHSGVAPGAAHSAITALAAMAGRRAPAPLAQEAGVRWPALLVIQGGADTVVAPGNGRAAAEAWAAAAGARAAPVRQLRRGQRHPMRVTDYRAGRRHVATLVEIPALGHAWSGGAAAQAYGDPRGPDAARLVWAFAARQFKTAAG